jgi:uncharacterized protein (TIGR02597 family)
MNTPTAKKIVILGLFCLTTILHGQSTNVVTDPVGFITLTAVGGGYTYVSLGLTQPVASRGIVSGVSGTQVTVSDIFTNGQFSLVITNNSTNVVAFIEITSGPNAGFMDDIVSNSTSAVFTLGDSSSLISSGQTYKIYPHWTLNTAFGPPSQSGLYGSNSAVNADNVIVWDPFKQQPVTYWYRSTGATPGWRDSASPVIDRGNNALYVEQGIVIQRKVAGDATNRLVGAVKLGQTWNAAVGGGYTYLGVPYASNYTLSNALLYTGNQLTGVYGSNSAVNADNVIIWDPTTQQPMTYWYRSTGATPGWRDSSSPVIDRGTNQLPFGAVMVIQRKIATNMNYVMPAPY